MLAAIGWPLAEIFHPSLVGLARAVNPDSANLLVDGRSPSLLNGGLFEPGCLPALALGIFVGAVLELQDLQKKQDAGIDAVVGTMAATYQKAQGVDDAVYEWRPAQPGHLSSFDPLGVYNRMPSSEQREVMEKELLNGRVAMLAVSGYAAEEGLLETSLLAPL
jgi:hypothetical protein